MTQSVLFLLNSMFSITSQQEDISAGSVYKKLFQSAACRDERECAPCCPADVLQLVPCFQFRLFIATSTFLEERLGRVHRHTRDAHLCLTMLVDFAKQRPLKMLFIFKTGSNFCNSSCLSERCFSETTIIYVSPCIAVEYNLIYALVWQPRCVKTLRVVMYRKSQKFSSQ